jgi:hypothetical protein
LKIERLDIFVKKQKFCIENFVFENISGSQICMLLRYRSFVNFRPDPEKSDSIGSLKKITNLYLRINHL